MRLDDDSTLVDVDLVRLHPTTGRITVATERSYPSVAAAMSYLGYQLEHGSHKLVAATLRITTRDTRVVYMTFS